MLFSGTRGDGGIIRGLAPAPRSPGRQGPGSPGSPMQQPGQAAPGSPGPDTRSPCSHSASSPPPRPAATPSVRGPPAYLESAENTALLKFSRLPPQRTTRTRSSTIFAQAQEPPRAGRITDFLPGPPSPPQSAAGFSSSGALWSVWSAPRPRRHL